MKLCVIGDLQLNIVHLCNRSKRRIIDNRLTEKFQKPGKLKPGELLHALCILVREAIILFVFFSSEHECGRSQSAIACFVPMSMLYSEKSRTKL